MHYISHLSGVLNIINNSNYKKIKCYNTNKKTEISLTLEDQQETYEWEKRCTKEKQACTKLQVIQQRNLQRFGRMIRPKFSYATQYNWCVHGFCFLTYNQNA